METEEEEAEEEEDNHDINGEEEAMKGEWDRELEVEEEHWFEGFGEVEDAVRGKNELRQLRRRRSIGFRYLRWRRC